MTATEMLTALEPTMAALVVEALERLVAGEDPTDALLRVGEEAARQRAFDEAMKAAKG